MVQVRQETMVFTVQKGNIFYFLIQMISLIKKCLKKHMIVQRNTMRILLYLIQISIMRIRTAISKSAGLYAMLSFRRISLSAGEQ